MSGAAVVVKDAHHFLVPHCITCTQLWHEWSCMWFPAPELENRKVKSLHWCPHVGSFLLCTAGIRFVLVVPLETETHVLHNLTISRCFIRLLWQMLGRRSRLAHWKLAVKLQLTNDLGGRRKRDLESHACYRGQSGKGRVRSCST